MIKPARNHINTAGKSQRLLAAADGATEFGVGCRVRNPEFRSSPGAPEFLQTPTGWWFITGASEAANEVVRAESKKEAYVRAAARVYGVPVPWRETIVLPGCGFTLWAHQWPHE